MEIQNEITKTRTRINLLEHQNEKFKVLLDKALAVTLKNSESPFFETQFLQESIELIEEETGKLKEDLNTLGFGDEHNGQPLFEQIRDLEKLLQKQQEEIERLKCENAEIKFLLLHPESKNVEWLKNVLNIENEICGSSETSLVEERFRLQRKIVNLEKKKAELLIAINDSGIPLKDLSPLINTDLEKEPFQTKDDENLLYEYEDLRFKMLNLEDERSRLLGDLQCILDMSRREIAEEYSSLQERISVVERQKACLRLSIDPTSQNATNDELDNIFNAFRNLPLCDIEETMEEKAREERIQTELGTRFCPGVGLPMYCCIL